MCEPTHPLQGFCEIWGKRRFLGWFVFLGGVGPCLGISHPTHPYLGKISQIKPYFLGPPLIHNVLWGFYLFIAFFLCKTNEYFTIPMEKLPASSMILIPNIKSQNFARGRCLVEIPIFRCKWFQYLNLEYKQKNIAKHPISQQRIFWYLSFNISPFLLVFPGWKLGIWKRTWIN